KFPASPAGPTRAEELRRWAAQHEADLAQLGSRFQVDFYGFDRELQPADPGRLPADPQGPSTDILGALNAAASGGSGGRPLAGLFVASDGADNAELSQGVSQAATAELHKLNAPVSAPVYEGEAIAQNNSRSFVLKVIRDRVRVLLVVGRPSWDVRFLRQLLKKNPNVDLISFFILRTPGDDPHSSQDELSLIPFPTQEIFQEQLKTFDLVIFQNFNHRPYRMSQYLDGIAAYVRDGGAFAMIGGDQSFSAGDYAGTPIEDVLPITLLPSGPTAVDETPAQVRLTDAGRRHPVTELASSGTQNESVWAALPRLPGLNTIGPLKGGAQTLLQSAEGRPVLVVGEAGRGRVMALLSDSSWFWSFVAAGAQQGPRAYETFWHSAIRWLVRDPALTPMRVAAERLSFEPGSEPPAL